MFLSLFSIYVLLLCDYAMILRPPGFTQKYVIKFKRVLRLTSLEWRQEIVEELLRTGLF